MEILHRYKESISSGASREPGPGSYRWKMRKNSLCRKSFFFASVLPSNEGKQRKTSTCPTAVAFCFMLGLGVWAVCVFVGRGRGSKSVLKCKEMFVRAAAAAAAQLLGNGMKQAQQPQHKETKRGKGGKKKGGSQAHPCFQK